MFALRLNGDLQRDAPADVAHDDDEITRGGGIRPVGEFLAIDHDLSRQLIDAAQVQLEGAAGG